MIAVVTGASGGIGSICASMLASRDAFVALMDVSNGSEQAAIIEKEFGIQCIAVKLDVSDSNAVEAAFEQVLAWKGRVDLCVNAAGIFYRWRQHRHRICLQLGQSDCR